MRSWGAEVSRPIRIGALNIGGQRCWTIRADVRTLAASNWKSGPDTVWLSIIGIYSGVCCVIGQHSRSCACAAVLEPVLLCLCLCCCAWACADPSMQFHTEPGNGLGTIAEKNPINIFSPTKESGTKRLCPRYWINLIEKFHLGWKKNWKRNKNVAMTWLILVDLVDLG